MQTIIELNPRHPTLDHHRPGGKPLLGTALGINTMLCVALQQEPGAESISIKEVAILAPRFVDEDKPQRVVVEWNRQLAHSDNWRFEMRLISSGGETPEAIHFTASICSDSQCPKLSFQRELIRARGESAVSRDEIYKVYFHGPAFQVIADARIVRELAIARSTAEDARAHIPEVARLIEFGMQTSGLLELARSGRIMIPKRIDRITLDAREAANRGKEIYAVARTGRPIAGQPATDIEIIDLKGNIVAELIGYQTDELPFVHDRTASNSLRRLLKRSESVSSYGQRANQQNSPS